MAKKPDAAALLAALQGDTAEDEDTPPARPAPQLRAVPSAPIPAPASVSSPKQEEGQGAPPRAPKSTPKAAKPPSQSRAKTPRSELKHIGGYLDDATVEKVALLRIRLKLENSDLLKLAIEELYRKHTAKRAFGDA
jgi:hypothetical protein